MRALRTISDRVYWSEQRSVWRFAYRDPCSWERKLLACTPDRFSRAGIPLASPDIVRRRTQIAEQLAARLRTAFLASLERTSPVHAFASVSPTVSDARAAYFALYSHQSPQYRRSLERILAEFVTVVGDKPIDTVTDLDFKTYELRLAARDLANVTQRAYIAQVGMLFHFAQKKGWLRQDPRLTYRPPKEQLHDPNPMTESELKAFFEFVRRPARYRPVPWLHAEWIGIGLLTLGLRSIELIHAHWEDVNWDERFLFIRKSHPNKEPQALQNQPIPLSAWPQFIARRQSQGTIWKTRRGSDLTAASLGEMREALARLMKGFQWKRFRKSYATILMVAGNDGLTISRLLRHSAGGTNTPTAARHYVGRSVGYLRDVVDEAFKTYGAMISPRFQRPDLIGIWRQ